MSFELSPRRTFASHGAGKPTEEPTLNTLTAPTNNVVHGDNLPVLRELDDASFTLIYVDPPFNTGKVQARAEHTPAAGDQPAMRGEQRSYQDTFKDYMSFIEPRLREAHRLLADDGTLYVHLDWREVHYVKVLLDEIFGRECFLNELIWAYDYGAKSKKRWPSKHDTILVYVKNPKTYHYDSTEVDREPYMAPGMVSAEKAAAGKLPTDVWWHTIVPTNGKEKTGYPTQKPEGILRRIITASSRPGDLVLDFFAGSGTTGAVAAKLGRRFVLIDQNPEAIDVMRRRLPADTEFVTDDRAGE